VHPVVVAAEQLVERPFVACLRGDDQRPIVILPDAVPA